MVNQKDLALGAGLLIVAGAASKITGAGAGLSELGTGITGLVASPLTGTGQGLSALAKGFEDLMVALNPFDSLTRAGSGTQGDYHNALLAFAQNEQQRDNYTRAKVRNV